jgi:hypothetical protein
VKIREITELASGFDQRVCKDAHNLRRPFGPVNCRKMVQRAFRDMSFDL